MKDIASAPIPAFASYRGVLVCELRNQRSGRGLRAHFAAGATHVCLQPVHADGDFAARDRMLAALVDT